MIKNKRITNHLEINFEKYLELTLKTLRLNKYRYSRFPEQTNYYGYIFILPTGEEVKIPMKEFLTPLKNLPKIGTGFIFETDTDLVIKKLPDWVADDQYEEWFLKKVLEIIYKKKEFNNPIEEWDN